jgi:hypothetical protein
VSESKSDDLLIERGFPDGRRVEVVEVVGGALARVYAPSGRVYLEQTYDTVGEATAAITVWDGLGKPPRDGEQKQGT